MSAIEWVTFVIGVVAAALVLASYIFKEQRTLRIVNLVASIIFVIYGIGLVCGKGDWTGYTGIPTIVLNLLCALVHIYYLFFKKKNSAKQGQPDETKEKSTNPKEEDK